MYVRKRSNKTNRCNEAIQNGRNEVSQRDEEFRALNAEVQKAIHEATRAGDRPGDPTLDNIMTRLTFMWSHQQKKQEIQEKGVVYKYTEFIDEYKVTLEPFVRYRLPKEFASNSELVWVKLHKKEVLTPEQHHTITEQEHTKTVSIAQVKTKDYDLGW